MIEVQKDIFFSSDKKDMDMELIYNFIHNSYWGNNRTFEEQKKAVENTLNFGLFHNGNQIAFTRVMTDFVFFAYILDVFVIEDYQGKGLSKLLMKHILEHEPIKNVDKWILATRDAHGLYSKFGFESLKNPDMIMEKMSERAKKIYQ
ncbi:GNAT family N-acetyltransferase [Flavobacteriaceae bacterium S0825]|uniref:GNAT family N-acetyltransferase n=1 Tax=Gaetbulibacter sp. S0825 TaxID=2720084 RepID=UPI001AD8204A|nr:GNAT family N-acetyltransferase [Gaetbulibacter sp. S0825]MCK0110350.1 GNAT family N-acetyltransferase [Flavobacteriaceae bacterium S0825]